ncbi:MAG: phage holin family protein [Luteolibacter sp.]|uniref:phage holin family protein n=1 Tax=Luteolibacter sp. TaxID=1962973 RepID=UPI00326389C4
MGLIASRVALIQLESKDAARDGAKRAGLFLAVVGCVFFAWTLLLAGGVSLIASSTGWPWAWVAIGVAVFHLLLAVIFAKLAKPSGNPAFPHTRAEFQKDREWIENFQKAKKSND